jgi:subtilisin family serine protease
MISFGGAIDSGKNAFVALRQDAEFTLQSHSDLFSQLRCIDFETVAPQWRNLTEQDQYDRHGNHVDLVDFTDVYRVRFAVDASQELDEVRTALRGITGVTYAECDDGAIPLFTPDDEYYTDQWNLNNTEQSWPVADCDTLYDINAPQAWDIWDSAGTKIGICDGSLDKDHEDLDGFIDHDLSKSFVKGYTWYGSGGHGTLVAGVAAAGTDNSDGISGVTNLETNDDDSLLVSLRIKTNTFGDSVSAVATRVCNAFSYLTTEPVYPKVLVVNNSWGYPAYKNCFSYNATLRDAFRNAFNMDINLICASGNGPTCAGDTCEATSPDTCLAYPAAFEDYVLAVQGIQCDGSVLQDHNVGSHIDLSAPGGEILTTTTTDNYGGKTGTSVAAPHASGAIALLLGLDPSLTNEDCYNLLRATAVPLAGGDSVVVYGRGVLKLDAALDALVYPRVLLRDYVTITDADSIDARWQEFMNVDSLNNKSETWETLWVHVYELEQVVDLANPQYASVDAVWGRGKTSTGWKNLDKYDARLNATFVGLKDWDAGESKATLVSYSYLVFEDETLADTLGWFPEDPVNGFRMDYTAMIEYQVQQGRPAPPIEFALEFRPEALPATGVVLLRLSLPTDGMYTLSIYDIAGRQIRQVVKEAPFERGVHRVTWDGRDRRGNRASSGVYFARLESEDGRPMISRTARIVLIR